ncbi:hypothetical protein RFI_30360, partial [Reticulomyxa filosa]
KENIRRRHNYFPFAFALLRVLAQKNALKSMTDRAQELKLKKLEEKKKKKEEEKKNEKKDEKTEKNRPDEDKKITENIPNQYFAIFRWGFPFNQDYKSPMLEMPFHFFLTLSLVKFLN